MMQLAPLCQNPACGAFIDPPAQGVPFLDRETKQSVMLCHVCAGQFESMVNHRYKRIAEGEG